MGGKSSPWQSFHLVSPYRQRLQISNELNRDVKFNVIFHSDSDETMVAVLVASGSHEVDDTWNAAKMCHQLGEIRKLRSKHLPDSKPFFFEPLDHQLIGVGFTFCVLFDTFPFIRKFLDFAI
mmetsp:Transcript_30725/g.95057  ORF Transcript_30725/g.95057 Transcript_30725/m.95057 type:complete len:122 (-) Transcript_30725:956-1321(-)